jgi:hypothetical protein
LGGELWIKGGQARFGPFGFDGLVFRVKHVRTFGALRRAFMKIIEFCAARGAQLLFAKINFRHFEAPPADRRFWGRDM